MDYFNYLIDEAADLNIVEIKASETALELIRGSSNPLGQTVLKHAVVFFYYFN